MNSRLKPKISVLVWILALAVLSVGAKNFEPGLSIDGLLYACISRNLAHSSDWFLLRGSIPPFEHFFEHPHLVFWIHALLFKILPAQDWAARIPSHLAYVAVLWLFFDLVKKFSSSRTATLSVLLLWSFPVFSNYFSNLYLDPINLLFGMAALWLALRNQLSAIHVLSIGVLMAGGILSKGPTLVMYGVVIFGILAYRSYKEKRTLYLPLSALSFGIVLLTYCCAVKHSSDPQFLELYFSKQYQHRFGPAWSFVKLADPTFWRILLHDTHFFVLPLVVATLVVHRKKLSSLWLPISLTLGCILFFAPIGRFGQQYWLYIMPWLAWLAALSLEKIIPGNDGTWRKFTLGFSIVVVLFLQYTPLSTHKRVLSPEILEVATLAQQNRIHTLWIEQPSGQEVDFTYAAYLAWYGNVQIKYTTPDHSPDEPKSAWLVYPGNHRNVLAPWKQDQRFSSGAELFVFDGV